MIWLMKTVGHASLAVQPNCSSERLVVAAVPHCGRQGQIVSGSHRLGQIFTVCLVTASCFLPMVLQVSGHSDRNATVANSFDGTGNGHVVWSSLFEAMTQISTHSCAPTTCTIRIAAPNVNPNTTQPKSRLVVSAAPSSAAITEHAK